MALGMIVISTNVGGLPKLIEDSVNGFLVDPNDANQILNLINTIISRKELNVSLNARKKAKTFDWTEVKEDWKRCFYLKN